MTTKQHAWHARVRQHPHIGLCTIARDAAMIPSKVCAPNRAPACAATHTIAISIVFALPKAPSEVRFEIASLGEPNRYLLFVGAITGNSRSST
jgi:hypothetical protein